ncbi:hypothetical protein ACVJF1_002756 [Bradyrhizobium diazoefficiens]
MGVADRTHGEQVVEGQGEIARGHEQRRHRNLARLGALDRLDHLVEVDAAQHVVEHIASDADDRDADHNSKLMQDLLLAQKRHRPAYGFQHLDLEQRFSGQDGRRTGKRRTGTQRTLAAGSGIAHAP